MIAEECLVVYKPYSSSEFPVLKEGLFKKSNIIEQIY